MSSKSSSTTVFWWLGWIFLTLVSFFVSCIFWTYFIAKQVGTMDKPGAPILWVTAVFGTWMIFLIPLIVVMYNKVDKAYEDGRIAQEKKSAERAKSLFNIKSVCIDPTKRTLRPEFSNQLKTIPEILKSSHLLTLVLKNGRIVENVFVKDRREILGVYGADEYDFEASDIQAIRPQDPDRLPIFTHEGWLRLDGVNP